MKNTDKAEQPIDASGEGFVPRFGKHQWIPYVLPLVVFMLAGNLEPNPQEQEPQPVEEVAAESIADDEPQKQDTSGEDGFIAYSWYPLVYTLRIGLTLAAIAIAWPMYRSFPFRVSLWSVLLGVAGVGAWVALCNLNLEQRFLPEAVAKFLGVGGSRVAYNPLAQLGEQPVALVGFLAVRFLGLALVVPLIEEFFLRGFLARFVQDGTWWQVPIGLTGPLARIAIVAYAALSHPGEMVAAMVWFSAVTLLVMYTKSIWDAVAAHIVTNLLLGIYVLATHNWELW